MGYYSGFSLIDLNITFPFAIMPPKCKENLVVNLLHHLPRRFDGVAKVRRIEQNHRPAAGAGIELT